MKPTLSIIASCFAFSLLSSCGDGENTSASDDATPPPEMKRIVSVLQSDGWANTPRAVALIEEYAKKIDLELSIERTIIKTDEDVQKHKFIGSPTVRINGLDVDPTARNATQFGFTWRLLNWTQGASTTEKMLHDAFIEAAWIDLTEPILFCLQAFREPHLDNWLPCYAHPLGLAIQRSNHPGALGSALASRRESLDSNVAMKMKTLIQCLSGAFLFSALTGICFAGPTVVPHAKAPSVEVRDDKFVIVQEFKNPKQIGVIQGVFLRSKRIGDTSSHLKTPTHKIDFSDRWLIDLENGEIGVLSKRVVGVFQIDAKDLVMLRKLIKKKA